MTHALGTTTNFRLDSPDGSGSFWAGLSAAEQANITGHANFLIGPAGGPGTKSVLEAAFDTTTGWFGTDTSKFGTGNRQEVSFDTPDKGGASNNGYGHPIHIGAQADDAGNDGDQVAAMLWMAEWSEILMSLTSNWNAGDSSGEGLSQYCAGTLFLAGHNSYYGGGFVQYWLTGGGPTNVKNLSSPTPARSDWVNQTFTGASGGIHGDGDTVSFGCALAFVYYLTVQLGFSINEVIANYKDHLDSCYHAVTGDHADPFPAFLSILSHVYPAGQPLNITAPNPDNLFPIAQVSFYAQKNTFGKDEAQDIINRDGGLINEAFWVVVDGLSKQAFQSLGVQVGPFTGAFAALDGAGVEITPNPLGAQFQNGVHPKAPQRIRIPFDIKLSSPLLGRFPSSGTSGELDLSTTLTSGGTTVSGSNATMDFELIAAGDPYFANINPQQNNQPYLSQDLRVFSAAPAFDDTPVAGGPRFTDHSFAGAYSYIQGLLGYLNSTTSFTNPAGADAFSLLPGQGDEGQTDSSVAPFAFQFPAFAQNFNFAIARVRMRGSSGASGAASNVRVFFRVFASQSPDTDFDPNGTYASDPDAAGHPGTPKPGAGQTTVPFFATANAGTDTDYQPSGVNNQTLTIPAGQDDLYAYYGCFLNFYDPSNTVAGHQVQTLFPGTHHCIVAQIAYDDAPIPAGVSPISWDQLAQRNLQLTLVDNPGPAATHRAPQTFDIRPSKKIGVLRGAGLPPDELMIDWGEVPNGSIASIYWPGVAAKDVIQLAGVWGAAAGLSASDAHTLHVKIEGGITYLPIPEGAGENFAGLLTIELPFGIKTGQEFEVVVRRISSRVAKRRPPPSPPPQLNSLPRIDVDSEPIGTGVTAAVAVEVERVDLYRYVVGTFTVRVPVSTGEVMRIPEEMTLAVMKWRLENLSPSNRWFPVLERYLKYSAARLEGIGGDPRKVPASIDWHPEVPGRHRPPRSQDCDRLHGQRHHDDDDTASGKVVKVLFDCHGEFEGFVLDGCRCRHLVASRVHGIGELALRAAAESLTVRVTFDEDGDRIAGLAVTAE